jgi:hypothetical protein
MVKIFLYLFLMTEILFGSVGKVVTSRGEVTLLRGQNQLVVKAGLEIEEKDTIKTSSNGKLQIIFSDDTLITIGKESEFSVKEYLYDNNKNSKASFGISKGTFRAITGAIGKIAPQNFKLTSKSASIGIRGTQIYAEIKEDFDFVACTEGTITVTSLSTGQTIEIPAGSFTIVKPDQDPQTPTLLEDDPIGDEDSIPQSENEIDTTTNNGIPQDVETPQLSEIENTTEESSSEDSFETLASTSEPEPTYDTSLIVPNSSFSYPFMNTIPSLAGTSLDGQYDYSFFSKSYEVDEIVANAFWESVEATFSPIISSSQEDGDVLWGEWANETPSFGGFFVGGVPTEYGMMSTWNNIASYTGFTKAKDTYNNIYNGTITMTFNFSDKLLDGTISPNENSVDIYNFSGNNINDNYNNHHSATIYSANQQVGGLNGAMYGTNGTTAAGTFTIDTASQKLSGIYVATDSTIP